MSEQRTQPAPKGVYIQTFGCQMNEYDSAKMLEQLRGQNYVPVGSPGEADLVLVNTCAIREKSEHKVYSLLGELRGLKRQKPGMVIGVGGCVAQQRGQAILDRAPGVDMVFGTDNLFELPDMLGRVAGGERVVQTRWQPRREREGGFIPDFGPQPLPDGEVKAQVAITKGCDNMCTFCIVPFTRGREVSRTAEDVLGEARRLVDAGARELMLLGQNVNSYRAGSVDFVELLHRLNELDGLERIRYTSPHPKDFDERLADAHATLDKLCEHVHLPFQAGSDRILEAMRRNHVIATYLDKIRMVRDRVPGIAVSTDIIVGFPGETEADFQATLDVMREVRFDQVYAFKYSPRTRTPAATMDGQVAEPVKAERLARLFELHEATLQARHEALVGTRAEVLLEGPHPRGEGAMSGRTRSNKAVMVQETAQPPGALVPVEIVAARKFSLVGRDCSRD